MSHSNLHRRDFHQLAAAALAGLLTGAGWNLADEKKEPAKVSTGVFQDKEHDGLSALLYSRIHAASRHQEFGDDFQLVPNPHARVPLPEEFRLRGTCYAVETRQDGYDVTPVETDAQPHFRFDNSTIDTAIDGS